MVIAIMKCIGGSAMGLTTKSIFLTLVLVFMGSVGFAQKAEEKAEQLTTQLCTKEEYKGYNDEIKKLQGELNNSGKLSESQIESIKAKLNDARASAKACADGAGTETQNKNTQCKELKDEMNKIVKDFPVAAQRRALTCFGEGMETNSSPDIFRAVAQGFGISESSFADERSKQNEICRSAAPKSDFSDRFEKKERDIEKYEEKIEKLKKEIIEVEKDSEKTIADLETDKLDLRKAFDKLLKEQKIKESEALAAKKEAQLKIESSIREARSKLKEMKLQKTNLAKDRKDKLLEANLGNFSSMQFTCNNEVMTYCAKNSKSCTVSKSKSLGQATRKGGNKFQTVNNVVFKNCLLREDSKRASIYRNYEQGEVKLNDAIADTEAMISTLQNQLADAISQYETALQDSRTELTKEEYDYNIRDTQLAKRIIEQKQITEKEKKKLQDLINATGRKILASQNSLGEINEDEAEELLRNGIKYADAMESHADAGCFGAAKKEDRDAWKGYKTEYESALNTK